MIVIKTLEDYIEVLKLTSEHVNKQNMGTKFLEQNLSMIKEDFDHYLQQGYEAIYDEDTNTMSYREKAPS